MTITFSMRHIFGLFFFLFVGAKVSAQSYELKGDYFVRSSTDFLSNTNKIGVLHNGSTFRVVQQQGKVLEIEVTAMTPDSYLKPTTTGKYYLYKANGLHFKDRSEHMEPKVEAAVAKCETCHDGAGKESASAIENRLNISRVADEVAELANVAPKGETKVKEIKSLIGPSKRGSLDDQIKKYSGSAEVKKMIDWAMKNKSSASKGMCYRKVKEAAATQCGPNIRGRHYCKNPFAPEGGARGKGHNLLVDVPTTAADQAALSAKTRLKDFGFVNLLDSEPYKTEMKSPSQAPKGSILVYSSGIPCRGSRIADCGHVEIKTDHEGKAGYVSDYYSADPINETARSKKWGSNYKLVGVMIKPKE